MLVREAGQIDLLSFAKRLYGSGSPYFALVVSDKGHRRLRLKEWANDLRIYKLVNHDGRKISKISGGKNGWSTVKAAYERAAVAIVPHIGQHFRNCPKCRDGKRCSIYERLIKIETGEKASLSYVQPITDLSKRQAATVLNLLDGIRVDDE